MHQLERKMLLEILTQQLNRDNVLYFIQLAYNKLTAQKNTYTNGEVEDSEEVDDVDMEEEDCDESENSPHNPGSGQITRRKKMIEYPVDALDSLRSLKSEEEHWLDFFIIAWILQQ